MANVLDSEKQQQIRALGRLGWSLRRIEQETGTRRETVSRYLKRISIMSAGTKRTAGRFENSAAPAANSTQSSEGPLKSCIEKSQRDWPPHRNDLRLPLMGRVRPTNRAVAMVRP